jgi:non-heme Fe2+,alpha-ketoglutarate-dependent halogenase
MKGTRLTQDQLDKFVEDGFIGPLNGSIPIDRIDQIANRLQAMIDSRSTHPLYNRFSVRDWHLIDSEILSLFQDPCVLEATKQLLGEDILLWRSKVFDKQPGEGALGWHQEWGAFNGEEIGNDVPGLQPSHSSAQGSWNLTVWFALTDIDDSMGPLRMSPGSQRRRFPISMAPLPESEFWHDPFIGIDNAQCIVDRANSGSLVLDVDTSKVFSNVNTEGLTLDEAKEIVLDALSHQRAATTLEFNSDSTKVINLPMRRGQFVIFTERTMHGSSANTSPRRRLAINCRLAKADTLVYPGRLAGNFIDGSNIDISRHWCVLVSGEDKCGKNVLAPFDNLPHQD